MLRRFFLILFLLVPGLCMARDIDVDGIYLDRESDVYRHLLDLKLGAWEKAGQKLAENTVFACWAGGDILYVREFKTVNILYVRSSGKDRELVRIPGTVTAVIPDSDGSFVYIKYIVDSAVPENFLKTVNLRTGISRDRKASNLFMDFAAAPSGSSLIYESGKGICEEFTDSGLVRLLIPAEKYYSIIRSGRGNPTVALFSPNRQRCLLMNGSGGSYRSMLTGGGSAPSDITSPRETFWTGMDSFIYRSGGTGNYSVCLRNTEGRSVILQKNSLNTNICVSVKAGMASFLDNQLIKFCTLENQKITETGLEGEDVFFSPDGASFAALFHGNLYLVKFRDFQGKISFMKENAAAVLKLYRQAQESRNIFMNEFSLSYLKRKTASYEQFLSGK